MIRKIRMIRMIRMIIMIKMISQGIEIDGNHEAREGVIIDRRDVRYRRCRDTLDFVIIFIFALIIIDGSNVGNGGGWRRMFDIMMRKRTICRGMISMLVKTRKDPRHWEGCIEDFQKGVQHVVDGGEWRHAAGEPGGVDAPQVGLDFSGARLHCAQFRGRRRYHR